VTYNLLFIVITYCKEVN